MADITALMAGTVNEIKVNVNDSINAGQEVLILESMKMLIPLPAPSAGVVKEIKAEVGKFVNQGEVLMVLE